MGASPRYATTFDACECTRSRPTYVQHNKNCRTRARDGRVSDVIKAIMVIIIGGLRP